MRERRIMYEIAYRNYSLYKDLRDLKKALL